MGEVTDKKNVFGFTKKPKNNGEIEQYLALIKKEPDNDRNYIRLAEIYTRSEEEEKAIETYEKAALLFEKKGFYNKAKAVLKQALALNPEHGRINVLLADLDKGDGLIKDAVIRYQIAANYYVKLGNKQAAITILKKIVDIQPQNTGFAIKLATLLVAEKMYHDAEKILKPLMVSLKSADKSADYIAVLKLLYTAKGESAEIGRELVSAYIRSGNHQSALSILYKLIMASPESIELLEQLVLLFEKMGEKEKLQALYKQLATLHGEQRNTEERNRCYRKVLEMNPRDTEALLALNEEDKLRDIISGKIAATSAGLDDDEEEGEGDIEIDMEDQAVGPEYSAEEPVEAETAQKQYNIAPFIKEAQVFRSYRLFDRAIEKLRSFPLWDKDAEALDMLAEIYIEKGDMASGVEMLFLLIETCIEKGDTARAKNIFHDVRELLDSDPARVGRIEQWLAANDTAGEMPMSHRESSPAMPEPAAAEAPVMLSPEPESPVMLVDPSPAEVTAAPPADDAFADMARELLHELDELREPPQKQLDELEFFISIDDFQSATILLQELISSYPSSELLAGFKNLIPMKKEENIADTLDEVKASLSKTMKGADKSAEDFYNMGIVHLSMGMAAEAIGYFEQAAQIDEDSIKYLMAVSDAWFQSGKNAQSLKYALKAAEKTEDRAIKAEILEKIANLYYSVGDVEKQRLTLEEIQKLK